MEPLTILAIALAVFALFVLITAYILKSTIAFNSLRAKSAPPEKDFPEGTIMGEEEGQDKNERRIK
ncbi:hypothetical protein [Methanolobus chelungpuianus]|uniref:Uncharacterized protein n=1 Tax=Methanolobus chelungpuianus TaxID=502115 RepID=A0AAE3H9R6_9EURY|nr:hypothetical protein [Methanolobus chelungpuianus]MCQ6961798.1 hypothetical protein [Methanolobus chelungpuianus]